MVGPMSTGTARGAGIATLDMVAAGIADQINNALAIVLLDVAYLDHAIDELAEAAGRSRAPVDGVVGDVVAAVARMRDVVRDLDALTGDDHADAGETVRTVMRLVRAEPHQRTELVDGGCAAAPTAVARRQLATIAALALGEVQRALAGARATLTVSVEHADDGEIAIGLRATVAEGDHALDRERGAWRAIGALLGDCGGRIALEPGDGGFAVEMRVPAGRDQLR